MADKESENQLFRMRADLSEFWGGLAGEPVFGIGSIGSGRSLSVSHMAETLLTGKTPEPKEESGADEPESPDCSA